MLWQKCILYVFIPSAKIPDYAPANDATAAAASLPSAAALVSSDCKLAVMTNGCLYVPVVCRNQCYEHSILLRTHATFLSLKPVILVTFVLDIRVVFACSTNVKVAVPLLSGDWGCKKKQRGTDAGCSQCSVFS